MDTQYKIKNAGCYIRCITPVSRGSTEAAHTTYHILAAQQEPYRSLTLNKKFSLLEKKKSQENGPIALSSSSKVLAS